ncbi:hypothetical protein B296_00033009 [Ensete ventricosum]|uniref:Transposase (putative) gypsy type domain-containing protein n=1 Tax=Ensete ventricosum TaxID=4639 RepID=A0A426XA76_ENSVE|nr:hypothetical protein B296_00033009 [Ensete ventricosum]
MNLEGLAEKVNSGKNPGDLAEKVSSGTNHGDLAKRANSGTNLGDLAERVNSDTNHEDLVESVFGAPVASRREGPKGSRGHEGGSLPRYGSDEGSITVIRGWYNIPTEFGLHIPQPEQRPYSSDAPGMCISVDALEAGLRFPLHPLIEECLRWWRNSPSQVAPTSWHYLVVFLGECRGAGITPTRDLFIACFCLCKGRGNYYLTARVGFRMDLGYLRGMPKMSSGKALSTRATAPAQEVGVSPVREASKTSSKSPIDAPTGQTDDPARRHKKVKVLTRRYKPRHDEGESRSHSKDKKPTTPSEEPDTPVESDEGGASSVHHRQRSMKDLFKTKVHKDDAGYYTLQMSDMGHQDSDKEIKARWRGLKNSTKVWNDSSTAEKFERGLLHPQLARELYMLPSEVLLARVAKEMVLELDTLKSGGGPEAVAKAEERVSELGQELEKTKRERDEALLLLETSEKDLSEVRSNLAEVQRLLKEARVRAWKMDDELLQAVKALENARTELPRQAIVQYKESTGFKEGLKRIG